MTIRLPPRIRWVVVLPMLTIPELCGVLTVQAAKCVLPATPSMLIRLPGRTFEVLSRLWLTVTEFLQLRLVRAIAVWRSPVPSTASSTVGKPTFPNESELLGLLYIRF